MWDMFFRRVPLLLALVLAAAPAAAQDAVERLRETLPMGPEDVSDPRVIQHRQDTLQKRVDALKNIAQLRRALALEEWKPDTTRLLSDKLRAIDLEMRKQVGDRLTKAIRDIVRSSDAHGRLAVANLIAEMGPTVRALAPADVSGYASSLLPEVIELTRDKDLAVRQEALRALSNINAPVDKVAPVLAEVLRSDSLGPRRLAADGLAQLVRVISHLQKRGGAATGISASREEVVQAARQVLGAALVGLADKDRDQQVRALSLIAFQVAAQAIADQIPDGHSRKDFPPEDRALTAKERNSIREKYAVARADVAFVETALATMRDQAAALVAPLSDPDPFVRLTTLQALEGVAGARLRLRRRVLTIPALTNAKGDADREPLDLVEKNDPLTLFLPKGLAAAARLVADPDARLRRASLDFLEMLEEAAEPAQAEIVAALGDSDRFVRWAATRILGRFPPEKLAAAAPHLARNLLDSDVNVRTEAAHALESMGKLAAPAAPALARALAEGDAEPRLAAMQALQRLDADVAQVALPQLTDALKHPDARVRRGAADTLGKIGPAAKAAIPALRRAFGDEDPEVRSHASDAILSIQSKE